MAQDGDFAPTRDYVVRTNFRGHGRGKQLRLHLVDAGKGIYRLKNSDDMYASDEIEAAIKEGLLEDYSLP